MADPLNVVIGHEVGFPSPGYRGSQVVKPGGGTGLEASAIAIDSLNARTEPRPAMGSDSVHDLCVVSGKARREVRPPS